MSGFGIQVPDMLGAVLRAENLRHLRAMRDGGGFGAAPRLETVNAGTIGPDKPEARLPSATLPVGPALPRGLDLFGLTVGLPGSPGVSRLAAIAAMGGGLLQRPNAWPGGF